MTASLPNGLEKPIHLSIPHSLGAKELEGGWTRQRIVDIIKYVHGSHYDRIPRRNEKTRELEEVMKRIPGIGYTTGPERQRKPEPRQFEKLRATELYCPQCRRATPVRERLLLVLPEGDKYEYLCAYCGTSVGDRIEKGEQKPIVGFQI